MRAEGHVLFVT